jgi:isopentenyldiphosphate isomerase
MNPTDTDILDIVNEQDGVIGQAPRREVHRRGWRHRAVHVLVFNRVGQLFLQKRSLTKDTFPGAWDSSASGHLDRGETYDTCAMRETQEELGITLVSPPLRLFQLSACPATGNEFVWVYRTESEGPFRLPPEEIERGEWFSPATIAHWLLATPGDFASSFPLIWNRLGGSEVSRRA